jgi:hypothetical protein
VFRHAHRWASSPGPGGHPEPMRHRARYGPPDMYIHETYLSVTFCGWEHVPKRRAEKERRTSTPGDTCTINIVMSNPLKMDKDI